MIQKVCCFIFIVSFSGSLAAFAQETRVYMLLHPVGANTVLVRADIPADLPDAVDPVEIGPLGVGFVTSMALAPTGQIIGLDATGDQLVEIDPGTGAATPLVQLDLDAYELDDAIAFDESGQLWLVHLNREVYRINFQTGATTFVVELSDEVNRICFFDGAFFAAKANQWVEIDLTTGVLTLLQDLGDLFLMDMDSNEGALWWIEGFTIQGGYAVFRLRRRLPESDAPIHLPVAAAEDGYYSLVVITRQLPEAIPTQSGAGLGLFFLLLAGLGVVILRWKRVE